MASRADQYPCTSLGSSTVIMHGKVILGASGAISSQSCNGFTVTQTGSETGRYTVALSDYWLKIANVVATLEISADTAAVQAKGVATALRGVSESGKVAYVQFTIVPTAAAAGADALPEDSSVIRITVFADNGKC